ncbi:hypothetical protein RRG08_056612 [Elysia crispata]|uniref:Uncharacterized protein n=1 Tax=Elysia crispata TaxID=231223 RepID=A0AAE1B1S2_9GAST|nr:hypothetical protein RRG08_056612 [Elysia crispata]
MCIQVNSFDKLSRDRGLVVLPGECVYRLTIHVLALYKDVHVPGFPKKSYTETVAFHQVRLGGIRWCDLDKTPN